MKIGIDARMMGKGFGLARYTEQLVLYLEKLDDLNEYVLFVRSDELRINNKELGHIKLVIADISWYSWKEQLKFKSIIKKEKVDLMHFPHWNVPLFYNDSFVVTVHDLTMYHFPRPEATTLGPVKFWLKDRAHRLALHHAVKKAEHVLVTSEFTKQDIHETLGVPKEKMTVTYQAPFSHKEQITNNKKQIFVGKVFVLTGTMGSITRDEAKEKIRAIGGGISGSVSKKTDFVVVGDKPGSKYDRAKSLGIKILDEKEFLEMLE